MTRFSDECAAFWCAVTLSRRAGMRLQVEK